MEMAVVQLGGHPVYTRGEEVGFDVREPVEDIARIMAGYHARDRGPGVRPRGRSSGWPRSSTCRSSTCSRDHSHPLQALADVLTMEQALGPLAGRTRRLGRRLQQRRPLARRDRRSCSGRTCALGCPPGFDADRRRAGTARLLLGAASVDAATGARPTRSSGADAVHTDTWASMGQEAEKDARGQAFEGVHRSTTR